MSTDDLGSIQQRHDFLAGGGEMARVIVAKDWSKTPLGPIEDWPQSLRTTVSICLASNFPISLAWGAGRTQIYNDGYWPICGGKHPHSMGQDFRECWASAWPVIGEAFESAERGEPRYLENQRIFIDRNGYLEETFFTFSFSPIRDDKGIQGLFHPVTETTGRMLSERRTRSLRDLASGTQQTTSVQAACDASMAVLAATELDIPFCLLYLPVQGGDEELRLVGHCGIEPDTLTNASRIRLDDPVAGPLAQAVASGNLIIVDWHALRFRIRAHGPYPEPPSTVIILPLPGASADHRAGVLIAGTSSRLPLDDAYRSFYDLLASQVAKAITTARAYEEERERAEALVKLDKAKTAFFSSVSHEFRTPLTLMLGPLEVLLGQTTETVTADRSEVDLVHRNALRLLRLVNSLLDFSRIEAGRAKAVFERIDLAALTTDISSSFRAAVEQAGLQFVVDCPALSEPVYVDRSMWETIVLNLLSNALKFTFAGEIRVILRAHDREVTLRVEDTGVGIPAAEIPRLFERFYRVEGSRGRTFEGTGIGLSLVQELVKLHGGAVQIESMLGAGSSFVVSIPVGFAHLPPDRVGAADTATVGQIDTNKRKGFVEESLRWNSGVLPSGRPPEKSAKRDSNSRRNRIVLADDNADMRQYIERLLADEYDVASASNGAEALRLAQENPPDLVLSDIMMPELDGYGLLAALRADERTKATPVVLLSARAGEEERTCGIGSGADDYLVKPFAARELLARVRTRIELAEIRSELLKQEGIRRNAGGDRAATKAVRHRPITHP